MTRVFVTGASGFVGRCLCGKLTESGFEVIAAVRHQLPDMTEKQVVVGTFDSTTSWDAALAGVDVVIHLAARVHVMHEASIDPLAEFRRVNVASTEVLARSAAAQGVRRFIFLSSIKVNGEQTFDTPFREQDAPNPQDPYAFSKWEAEQVLQRISAETGMEVVILRPPLIYGSNVRANFMRLLRWVAKGIPLPLASVHNLRSMLYLGNLVDVLMLCMTHPGAAGNTYLVSDGDDVATPVLISTMASAMGRPDRLWRCPVKVLELVAGLTGRAAEANRLLGSLMIDSSRIRRELGWKPPYSLRAGIQETVDWFMQQKNRVNG